MGFFHRFTCTRPTPPVEGSGSRCRVVTLLPLSRKISFAKIIVGFIDATGVDHDALGIALNKALYNYMHGIGLDATCEAGSPSRSRAPRCRASHRRLTLTGSRIESMCCLASMRGVKTASHDLIHEGRRRRV